MRTDKIRKYLIPNIPYLFILWAFLKLGTAYRLAAGNDFAHKLIGLGQTIGPAFADFARSCSAGLACRYCRRSWFPAADLFQKQERQEVPAGCRIRQRPVGNGKRHQTVCRSEV